MATSKNYYSRLLLQVSPKELSFAVKDMLSHEIVSFKNEIIESDESLETQYEHIFQTNEVLSQRYDDIIVLHDNQLNTFVPQALFDENAMGSYLQYNTKVFATDFFAFDELHVGKMNNVYIPYMHINNFLIDKFGSFTYQNINTPLVNYFLEESKGQEKATVYLYYQKKHFEIIVVQNRKLLFFNTFVYQSLEDFLYYLLFTYEQLQLDTETHPLYLFGAIQEQDDSYKKAYAYIRHIEILKPKAFLSDSVNRTEALHSHPILLQL